MSSQRCPVCFAAVTPNPRYRRYLCPDCASRAVSEDGRALTFYNAGPWGGFVAVHSDDQSPYAGHTCYVDGLRCHADEARFGGIVIEVTPMVPVLDLSDIEALLGCAHAEPSGALLSVFTTQVGLRFERGRRLLIVGRATNGWGLLEDGEGELRTQYPASHAETPERRRDWARRTLAHIDADPLAWADAHARRSAFVRVARRIAKGLGAPEVGWHQHVAWTELYKLGFAVESNPSEELMDAQLPVCRELLQKELRILNPGAVVFLVGCSPNGDWFQWFDEAIGFRETQRLDVGRDVALYGMVGETKAVVLPHPQGREESPLVDTALAHLTPARQGGHR